MKKIIISLLLVCMFSTITAQIKPTTLPYKIDSATANIQRKDDNIVQLPGFEFENFDNESQNLNYNCDDSINCSLTLTNKELSFASAGKSAFMMDAGSGTVVYSKNPKERLAIASMTKIMLLNFVFEAIEANELTFDEMIMVSARASSMGGSQIFLQANKEYSAQDLIKGVIIASANDASVALSERLFGSEEACVDEMNTRREKWDMTDTLFSNCTGLPKATQYSCARDVAIMLKELVKHKSYFDYSAIWLDELKHPDGQLTTLTNTNRLVRFYSGCDGGKTGYTDEAKYCLGATAKRGGLRMIAVVIGEPSSKERFSDVQEMFDYAFNTFTSRMIIDSSRNFDFNVPIKMGKKSTLEIKASEDYSAFSKRGEKCEYTYIIDNNSVVAPVKAGDKVGEITIFKDGVEVSKINVISAESVNKRNLFDCIKTAFENWGLTA